MPIIISRRFEARTRRRRSVLMLRSSDDTQAHDLPPREKNASAARRGRTVARAVEASERTRLARGRDRPEAHSPSHRARALARAREPRGGPRGGPPPLGNHGQEPRKDEEIRGGEAHLEPEGGAREQGRREEEKEARRRARTEAHVRPARRLLVRDDSLPPAASNASTRRPPPLGPLAEASGVSSLSRLRVSPFALVPSLVRHRADVLPPSLPPRPVRRRPRRSSSSTTPRLVRRTTSSSTPTSSTFP